MKITNKIVALLMIALLHIGFAGCREDEKIIQEIEVEETPDFKLDQEAIEVKIGAENKVTVNIQGGGEYNAFSLDETIAKVNAENDVVIVEGFVNGKTSLIISDKYNRYRRLPVTVYTTDVLELSHKELSIEITLGRSETVNANVVLGNGGYKVSSDNQAVTASVDEEGKISISATSKLADYAAILTVTDITGLSENITVTVKSTLIPFTDEEIKRIMSVQPKSYFYNSFETYYQGAFESLNKKLENGKQRYGWEQINQMFPSYSMWLYIDYKGDKSVGVKEDAQFSHKAWSDKIDCPITLEIIKNDDTNIWAIYSYVDENQEKLYTGYFCDTIKP